MVDTIIIGAGIAGLTAGKTLSRSGRSVLILDKGRSVGGRLATRRIDDARLDHGAQFFTVRSEEFGQQVADWTADGLVDVWCRGWGADDGHPRYRARGGMNALAKALVEPGCDIMTGALVFSVLPVDNHTGWEVRLDDGTSHRSSTLLITAPLPQTFSLLVDSGVELPSELVGIDYDRTLAALVVLDAPSAVPAPGGLHEVQLDPLPLAFVADHQAKGISAVPALTISANAAWSLEHFDHPSDTTLSALLDLAQPFIGDAQITSAQLKKWRLATPQRLWPEPYWMSDGLVIAGDAFAGPRATGSNMEGAFCSGLAAARAILA
jgi:predicted NAD/FAD-dependent oxidoreductase